MGIVEESISFITNFLTQILTIIAATFFAARYVITENKKGQERLSKKILGDLQDGKVGRGGLLDELRTELREEFRREISTLRTELVTMINDSHTALINEFRRTSTKISYMSRDLGRVEKTLEKMSKGSYTAAREETMREEHQSYDDIDNSFEDVSNRIGANESLDDFNKKYRKGRK